MEIENMAVFKINSNSNKEEKNNFFKNITLKIKDAEISKYISIGPTALSDSFEACNEVKLSFPVSTYDDQGKLKSGYYEFIFPLKSEIATGVLHLMVIYNMRILTDFKKWLEYISNGDLFDKHRSHCDYEIYYERFLSNLTDEDQLFLELNGDLI